MTTLDVLVAALFLASVTFVVWYGTTRAWWRSPEGWALIVSGTGWALLSGGVTYDDWVSEIPDHGWIVIAGWALVASCMKLALLVLGHHRKP